MSNTLYAGAARKIINPPLGIKRPGLRLFADPLQALETDLTATAVVLSNQAGKVVIIGNRYTPPLYAGCARNPAPDRGGSGYPSILRLNKL